jgi:hypothetical protein
MALYDVELSTNGRDATLHRLPAKVCTPVDLRMNGVPFYAGVLHELLEGGLGVTSYFAEPDCSGPVRRRIYCAAAEPLLPLCRRAPAAPEPAARPLAQSARWM